MPLGKKKRPLVYGVAIQSSCRIYVHTLMRHVRLAAGVHQRHREPGHGNHGRYAHGSRKSDRLGNVRRNASAPATAAELESRPINRDGPNDAANHVPRVEQCRSVRMLSGGQRLQAGRLRGLSTKPTPAYTTTVSATTIPMFMLAAVIEIAACPTAIRQSRPAAAATRHGHPSRVRPQSRSQRCRQSPANEQARNKCGHAVCALKIERQQNTHRERCHHRHHHKQARRPKRTLAMGRTLSTGCSSSS